jgi:DNA-binding MarR family transcriptional regulator
VSAIIGEVTALDDNLGFTLGVVFRAFVKASNAAVGDLPGSHRGFQLLTAAAADPPVSQSTLCQRLGIDRTVMTYLVDGLEAADLVVRMPDPADRRARLVAATDAGRARLDTLNHRLALAETHVLSGLDAADRASLKSLLGKLATQVNALDPVTNACAVVEDLATHAP